MKVVRLAAFRTLCALFSNVSLDQYYLYKAIAVFDVMDCLILSNIVDVLSVQVFHQKFDSAALMVLLCVAVGVYNYSFYSKVKTATGATWVGGGVLIIYLVASVFSVVFYVKR